MSDLARRVEAKLDEWEARPGASGIEGLLVAHRKVCARELRALLAEAREEAKPGVEHSDDCAVGMGGMCDCPAQEFDGIVAPSASAGTEGPGLIRDDLYDFCDEGTQADLEEEQGYDYECGYRDAFLKMRSALASRPVAAAPGEGVREIVARELFWGDSEYTGAEWVKQEGSEREYWLKKSDQLLAALHPEGKP